MSKEKIAGAESAQPKKKMKVWKKLLIVLAVVIIVPIAVLAAFVIVNTNNSKPSGDEITTAPAQEYFELKESDIKNEVSGKVNITPLGDNLDFSEVLKSVEDNINYSYADYYDIDGAQKVMKKTPVKRVKNISLLDSDNNIDADKLYKTVLANNKPCKNAKGVNTINYFYSDATNEEIKEICKLIAKVVNETKEDRDITETASALVNLKIFRHETSSDLAGISHKMVFYFNPNMIEMTGKMFELSNRKQEGYDEKYLTFVHEIEHIKQSASRDNDFDSGVEVGFCRKYDSATVNSLWDQWILEGAAEIKMTRYTGSKPMTYAKKIGYVNTYNLGYIFSDNELDAFVNSTFLNDLDEVYDKLNIKGEKEQRDFLNFLYSIQLTQYDCNDFWDYYQKKTGKTLSDDDKISIKMDIRTEAVNHLTKMFYTNLVKGIEDGKIRDVETVFFMLKVWELDCFNHLTYTEKNAFTHAKQYIIDLNETNKKLFEAISKNTNKSKQELMKEYSEYHALISNGKETKHNYRFYDLSSEKEKFLDDCFAGYSVTHFADIETMIDNIDNQG